MIPNEQFVNINNMPYSSNNVLLLLDNIYSDCLYIYHKWDVNNYKPTVIFISEY